jgi:hypothetical protein
VLFRVSSESGTQHTSGRLIRHAVITGDVTERFPLLDTLEYGNPSRGWDLPTRIRYSLMVAKQTHEQRIVKGRGERIFLEWGGGSVFPIDKQIASTGEKFFKGDACQGRPMVRCPSVPFSQ